MNYGSDISNDRLLYLNQRVKNNQATQAEKDELMDMLYRKGSITKKQYEDYNQGINVGDILGAALIIAGIILLGQVLSDAFSSE